MGLRILHYKIKIPLTYDGDVDMSTIEFNGKILGTIDNQDLIGPVFKDDHRSFDWCQGKIEFNLTPKEFKTLNNHIIKG